MKLKDIVWMVQGIFLFVVLCLFLGDSLLHCEAFMFIESCFVVKCVLCFFFSLGFFFCCGLYWFLAVISTFTF